MIAPSILGAAVFVVYPLVALFWYSVQDWRPLAGGPEFSGLDNYIRLLSDTTLRDSLIASGIFSVGLVALNMSIALVLAVLLNQKLAGTTVFRTIFFSPVVVSLVAWTLVWTFLLQNNGGINALFSLVGLEGPNWLKDTGWAMLSVIVVQVFKGVGLNMILLLAALQDVPEELVEASRIDGASRFRVFRSITMPLISPTLLLVSIVTVIGSLQVFAQIRIMTGGGPSNSTNVLANYLYQVAFEVKEFGYGSTVGVVMFVVVLGLTLVQWLARTKWVHNEN
ncbi:sugar ABC transporter permease [Salinibacterium sp. G-O1]|uniref:carbohydrate ABC transporter permease n=1 Tax=Salinibacterium sp. G-O1 TaxID=3046208 RepID=UPI0024BB9541|nr:sugar ABC transporter permease [Salinibacterium sp. G-O1]MDJ0333887.1 sugar ABC transporter permease [Salinibacterium sp. G-O1]